MVDGLPISRTKRESPGRSTWTRQSLSGSGTKVQVSTLGGSVPRWRRDGKELYYLAPDRMLMVVSVNLDGNQPRIGGPSPLFQTRVGRFMNRTYAVSRDGRFLVNTQVDDVTNGHDQGCPQLDRRAETPHAGQVAASRRSLPSTRVGITPLSFARLVPLSPRPGRAGPPADTDTGTRSPRAARRARNP